MNLRSCKLHGKKPHYKTKDGYFRCKVCNVEKVKRRHRKVKRLLVEYAGGKCIRCGYSKSLNALQFHHRDARTKSFGIAQKMYSTKLELLKVEVDKCDLICANCHFEVHEVEDIRKNSTAQGNGSNSSGNHAIAH